MKAVYISYQAEIPRPAEYTINYRDGILANISMNVFELCSVVMALVNCFLLPFPMVLGYKFGTYLQSGNDAVRGSLFKSFLIPVATF